MGRGTEGLSNPMRAQDSRPSHLAHQFADSNQQFESARLGMWIFLSTEILLFGGLFCAYAVFRRLHPEIFFYGHRYLDTTLGAINTAILITSSLTMAWAVRCAQLGHRRGLVILLSFTLVGGAAFLGIKYVEYEHKWKEGLLPGKHYRPHAEETASPAETDAAVSREAGSVRSFASERESGVRDATASAVVTAGTGVLLPPPGEAPAGLAGAARMRSPDEDFLERPRQVQVFFGVYFTMTGLHGLHVIAGMAAIAWILRRSIQGAFGKNYFTPVDLVGLYWHLVDLIWIFLFPLLYLIH